MYKNNKIPIDIKIILFSIIALVIYYFFFDYYTIGLFIDYGFTISSLTNLPYALITLFLFSLIIIALIAISYGFLNKKSWTRKFTILFLIWSMVWPLWALLIGNNILLNVIYLGLYLVIIYYLTTKIVKIYFQDKNIFTYKDYTLHKRDVKLKNKNGVVTIHFFAKNKPKSGTPCPIPENYEVGINPRSKMPYLKKKTKIGKKEEPKEKPKDKKKNNSNVIYVVSRPQPGQVKGDWAVRTHGKIFSHHRTKVNAIKAARKLGNEKKATVLIQKTDGTFSRSYKAKKDKKT